MRALLSVANRDGISTLARDLLALDVEVYEQKLAKQRYFTRSKFAHPEATIRPKGAKATRAGGSRPNAQRSRSNRGRRRR